MTAAQRFDLAVIGAGSGGVRAARLAAQSGAKVCVIETAQLGGTCVNLGCIPKKLFYYGSHFRADVEDARDYGWVDADIGTLSWPHLLAAKNTEIKRLNGIYGQLLERAGVQVLEGRARMLQDQQIEITCSQTDPYSITADRILIATGSKAVKPDNLNPELIQTSDDVFHMPQLPDTVAIIGGGYIAVEFACIFAGFGCQTHLIYRGAPLLRSFDRACAEHATAQIRLKDNLTLHLEEDLAELKETPAGLVQIQLSSGKQLTVNSVMAATGRVANTDGLGLEQAGVALDQRGYIKVSENWQTSAANIYAIGDVIGTPQLTPVAIAQAVDWHAQTYLHAERTLDYQSIPTAVFCQPTLGTVGMTESEAVKAYGDIQVYRSQFRELKNTLTSSQEQILVQLIIKASDGKAVGAQIVGGAAAEIIQCLAIAVQSQLTKEQFDQTLSVHPSLSEEFVTLKEWRAGTL